MVSTPLKNISQNGNLPQVGVNKKIYIWNHHLVIFCWRKNNLSNDMCDTSPLEIWKVDVDSNLPLQKWKKWLNKSMQTMTFGAFLDSKSKSYFVEPRTAQCLQKSCELQPIHFHTKWEEQRPSSLSSLVETLLWTCLDQYGSHIRSSSC